MADCLAESDGLHVGDVSMSVFSFWDIFGFAAVIEVADRHAVM